MIALQSDRPCILFVAMSFRTEQEPALVDYFSAINRAVTKTALDIVVQRMDLMEGDYEISQKLMSAIDVADIVLGDFTLNSANVYFEIGYARGKGKRIIQTTRKDTALEFDVRQWRTLVYRNATELEEKLELELRAAHKDAKRVPRSSGAA
jgi:nucleoside 2-deoxyribosyltransferase